ncbi:hypothetical protein ASPVEDRAFT_39082 [Aspergillus versicolor CBS 583.65]|uniref:Heme haloperoxidase family profile domain-containing protein n=1 Tax=Aspergillus versicolor CBS 583.65 TaxID=1036611 RepID=A0A1L9PDU9_ASPVE|nr:uncharacterized protein ASPVEDRAFT_39082 [Aspergillus versicolor CBS 583.65]OJI99706.1 hypothetical protein ASPVEDRAFT_39082 [Aspergillus versicolor CBS 583.65]
MKLSVLVGLVGVASATSHLNLHVHVGKQQGVNDWMPAGPDDARSPCPMLNTLANHGYLPRGGRSISQETWTNALVTALNFDPQVAKGLFGNAILSNTSKGAEEFDLDQMNVHNLLEHDASLSRSDAYFGNNHLFDPTVFAQTRQYWTDPTLTAVQLANSKLARQIHSKAFNPTYTYPQTTEETSYNEAGFPIIAFGNMEEGTVRRDWVEYFFENERLPTDLGWKVREEPITEEKMGKVVKQIKAALNMVTESTESGSGKQKRNPHSVS